MNFTDKQNKYLDMLDKQNKDRLKNKL